MRVRMRMNFRSHLRGDEVDLPYEEAMDLADSGVVEIPGEVLDAIVDEVPEGEAPEDITGDVPDPEPVTAPVTSGFLSLDLDDDEVPEEDLEDEDEDWDGEDDLDGDEDLDTEDDPEFRGELLGDPEE